MLRILSLVSFIGLGAAFVRSYHSRPESFEWWSHTDSNRRLQLVAIRSGRGSVGIHFTRLSFLDPVDEEHWKSILSTSDGPGFSYDDEVVAPGEKSAYINFSRSWYGMGFGFGWKQESRRTLLYSASRQRIDKPRSVRTAWLFGIPYWLPIMLTAFPPSWWLLTRWRRRARLRLGLCPRCGYDLRGLSGGRCPECGADVPDAATAPPPAAPPSPPTAAP